MVYVRLKYGPLQVDANRRGCYVFHDMFLSSHCLHQKFLLCITTPPTASSFLPPSLSHPWLLVDMFCLMRTKLVWHRWPGLESNRPGSGAHGKQLESHCCPLLCLICLASFCWSFCSSVIPSSSKHPAETPVSCLEDVASLCLCCVNRMPLNMAVFLLLFLLFTNDLMPLCHQLCFSTVTSIVAGQALLSNVMFYFPSIFADSSYSAPILYCFSLQSYKMIYLFCCLAHTVHSHLLVLFCFILLLKFYIQFILLFKLILQLQL